MTDMIDTTGPETDLWHVEVASGQVLVVTLEQLDEAFNRGQVNEHTRVWQQGMDCAVPLHELLGLDSEEAPVETAQPAAPVPVAAPNRQASYAPATAPSMYPQPLATAPRSLAPAPAAASTWPPVVTRPSAAPASTSSAWQATAVPSVIPTAFDVSDDFVPFAKPKRRGAIAFALVAMLAVAGGAATFLNGNSATASAAAVAAPPPVVEAPHSHAYDPGNEPIHLREVEPLVITKPDAPPVAATPKVSAADAEAARQTALKAANAKAPKGHAHAAVTRSVQSHGKAKGTGFKATKGGSKYDPLNGAL